MREFQGKSKFIRLQAGTFHFHYKFLPCSTEIANQKASAMAALNARDEMLLYYAPFPVKNHYLTCHDGEFLKLFLLLVTKQTNEKLFHLHLKNILLASCSQLTIIFELFALTERFLSISEHSRTEFKATTSSGIGERKRGFPGSLMT